MNTLPTQSPSQRNSVRSWLATGFVGLFCIVLALASGHFVEPFVSLFRGLGVELPWPTRFLLATYTWLLPLLFTVLAAWVILKEFSAREPSRKFLLTRRIFFAVLVTAGLTILALYLPVLTLGMKLGKAK